MADRYWHNRGENNPRFGKEPWNKGKTYHRIDKHARPSKPLSERFWEKVNRIEGEKVCWPWKAGLLSRKGENGYGVIYDNRSKKMELAHRISWELTNGPIPDGIEILHHCDNPACVRPDHLFQGDQKSNMEDMVSKGRSQKYTGEESSHHKLNEVQVREIKSMPRIRGAGVRLAKKFGVSKANIHEIWTEEIWKEIKPWDPETTQKILETEEEIRKLKEVIP
jgi:hypothetical protein